MDHLFDSSISLFCDENTKDSRFHHLITSEPSIYSSDHHNHDDDVTTFLERETLFLPTPDYLLRLRHSDLDLSARNQAFHWISLAHSYYSFGPLSLCLAVNYLDRFFSLRELPANRVMIKRQRDKEWTVQLLAVACLSIAAKMEETSVPHPLELQVGEPKYVFEAKTIQRMELLVLDTLKWEMNAITPCSFLDYSLNKLSNPSSITDKFLFSSAKVVNRSLQLILCTIQGIDYLEFKASEIAAAVALSVAAEIQAVDIDKATSCFIHLEKDRVLKCVEMIKGMSEIGSSSMNQGIPKSPIGVLDAGCFSYKTDESSSVIGSCSNSSQVTTTTRTTTSPATKRMKLDPTSTFNS